MNLAGSEVIQELVTITGDPPAVLCISDMSAAQHRVKASFKSCWSIRALTDMVAMFGAGTFTLPVARVLSLNQITDSNALSAQVQITGRLVVEIT